VDRSGSAWCWGSDRRGQLGDGDTTGATKFSPVAVLGGHTFTSVTAGYDQSCGVDRSGSAWCWGSGRNGQLGDGDTTGATKFSPVAVLGGHTFTSVTAGNGHTCGLDPSGLAWCWGYDVYGALGDGDTTHTNKFSPVAVAGGHTFISLTAGYIHSCGVDTSGSAWCWGDDRYGDLGDGDPTQTNKYSPVAVLGGHTFTSVTAGASHSCGLATTGSAWCWGYDGNGQLGDGSPITEGPVAVSGGHTFTSVTAGGSQSCGVDRSGSAWCWGYGRNGQLGDGDTTSPYKYSPVAVLGGHTFTSVTAGADHSCGLATSGSAWCWGWDLYGQLGDGDTTGTDKFSPVPLV